MKITNKGKKKCKGMYASVDKVNFQKLGMPNIVPRTEKATIYCVPKSPKGIKSTESYIVMNDTFWIGVYPGMREKMIGFMVERIREIVKR